MSGGRRCGVCAHPDRVAIDEAIIGRAKLTRLAAVHGVTDQALRRHRDNHIAVSVAKVIASQEQGVNGSVGTARALSTLDQLNELASLATQAARTATSGGVSFWPAAIREARATLLAVAELKGEKLPNQPVEQGRAAILELVDELRADGAA